MALAWPLQMRQFEKEREILMNKKHRPRIRVTLGEVWQAGFKGWERSESWSGRWLRGVDYVKICWAGFWWKARSCICIFRFSKKSREMKGLMTFCAGGILGTWAVTALTGERALGPPPRKSKRKRSSHHPAMASVRTVPRRIRTLVCKDVRARHLFQYYLE